MRNRLMRLVLCLALCSGLCGAAFGQNHIQSYILEPDRVFDGRAMQTGWRVRVEDGRIAEAGPSIKGAGQTIDLAGMTLLPGLIDAHTHVLLHDYDDVSWDDQVLRESVAERAARAVNHLRASLDAGFTTLRDLGSEGAGYADVGLRQALEKGVIEGPRLIVAGPAIVATGAYGPGGFHEAVNVPKGAIEVSGVPALIEETRRQIGGGADWIKIYADYRWGPGGLARATFSVAELTAVVETARAAGVPVVAHAASDEGMARAIEAGVETIEHGDQGTLETYRRMARAGIAICPTLAIVEAISRYRGWDGNAETAPERIAVKREQMRRILEAKTPLCNGSDAGGFTHGDNAWELELMVDYGASPLQALTAATSDNARFLHRETEIGTIAPGLIADLVAVPGNPLTTISVLRNPAFIMQSGAIRMSPPAAP